MLRLDEKGAEIVLQTHDDVNIEVIAGRAEAARTAMEQMMRELPAWAAGFPLFAKCAIMERYGK
jgi:DNA-binding FadR family transcriptional regulator